MVVVERASDWNRPDRRGEHDAHPRTATLRQHNRGTANLLPGTTNHSQSDRTDDQRRIRTCGECDAAWICVAVSRSSLQVVISDQFVKHASEAGLRVREYAPPQGEGVQCTVAADDDLLVARLAVDLSTASRVDLSGAIHGASNVNEWRTSPFAPTFPARRDGKWP